MAAFSLHHSPTPLGNYLGRMKAKLGPKGATMATAHKIAVIFYTMLKNKSNMTRPSVTLETPRERKDLKQNSNGKPNNWATNLSPSNPRLHNESLQTAGVPWKRIRICRLEFGRIVVVQPPAGLIEMKGSGKFCESIRPAVTGVV